MTTRYESRTLTEHVRDGLRTEILTGRIPPGTPLRLEALTKTYEVSRSVIREALIGLAEQNLVISAPNLGFRAIDVSPTDLVNLIELRILVESRAFELSIALGDSAWEASVISAHHMLTRASRNDPSGWGTSEEWTLAHTEFHAALCAACENPRLISLTKSLRDESLIYHQVRVGERDSGERDVAAEQRNLMDLAIDRNAAKATAALEDHLRCTTTTLLRSLS